MSASPHFLVGRWKNELGSTMEITEIRDDVFSGKYFTAVSGGDKALEGPLLGRYNPAEAEAGSLAFTVNWHYAGKSGEAIHSTTGWCGLVRGKRIEAQWLLARYGEPGRDWNSTTLGKDVFVKL